MDEGGQFWADNGKLGWNADAIVYSGNAYTFGGAWGHVVVVTIAKNSMLDQSNSTFTHYTVDVSNGSSLIPARMQGSVSGGPMWFVEGSWSGGSSD